MKHITLAGLYIFCIVNMHAETVTITKHYTGEVHSYFQRGSEIYTLEGYTVDGYVGNAFDLNYPYGGGTVINQQAAILSETGLGIVSAFKYTSGDVPDCWAWGLVDGNITIGTTAQYPAGTPLMLQIDYFGAIVGDVPVDRCYLDVAVGTMDYEVLWDATHLTSDAESYYLSVTAGSSYSFALYESMGNKYRPIEPEWGDSLLIHGVGMDFSVIIPEPATLLLVGIGAVVIRRRQ